MLSFYVYVARHFPITQNSKFVASLQYLNKEVSDEADFCMQINIKVSYKCYYDLWWGWLSILKIPKIACLQYLYNNISKNKIEMNLIFLHAVKHQMFLKVYFNNFLNPIFPTRWKDFLKVPNVTAFLYS